MKETNYICDHCGEKLDEMKDYTELQIEFCGDTIDCDLCKSCYDKLLKQTKDFVGDKK